MINRFKIFSKIMLLAMTSSLFAVNVTLNVDMSNVTVSDDGVHVAGSFRAGIQLLHPWQMMMVMVFTPSLLICQA